MTRRSDSTVSSWTFQTGSSSDAACKKQSRNYEGGVWSEDNPGNGLSKNTSSEGYAIHEYEITLQLEKILKSPEFRRAEMSRSMLRFIVEGTLAGHLSSLKEYCLGVEVFGRERDFDPKDYAVVRVQAGRLRRRLEAFYRRSGMDDPILIWIPKGRYVAEFEHRRSREKALVMSCATAAALPET